MEIFIHEVGLRDGLQMESEPVPTITKLQWTETLVEAGIDIIQLGSFVNPKIMPQMADTDELFQEIKPKKNGKTKFSGLILNEKGFERALKADVDLICMGVSASETHSKKNTGMSVSEALERIVNIAKEAIKLGKDIQVSVQSAFGCGYEGEIPEERVFQICERYFSEGINKVSLADTSGYAFPQKVERMYSRLQKMNPDAEFACHFHNTYGLGMVNTYVAMQNGVKYIETAFGGLGGCPFTKQPSGNVCTEDFVYMLQKMGLRNDINIGKIISVTKYACGFFVKDLPGYVYKIWREQ
ncbi:MAG: hydroxymethylglutaryl-CoA lyase [Ignavibacteria bacterium]|nr:hydroxymethylglutaryl-CoA lyase [Ignavibacteria bacterium]